MDAAEQALIAGQKKLAAGRSAVFEITNLEDKLIDAELNMISTKITAFNTFANLINQASLTLQTWGISINEDFSPQTS